MDTFIRFFRGKKNREIPKTGQRIKPYDNESMIRDDDGSKYIVTNFCKEALKLLIKYTEEPDVKIVIALSASNAKEEKRAREMKFYYTSKLIICYVIEIKELDDDDHILINCPAKLLKKIKENEEWWKKH